MPNRTDPPHLTMSDIRLPFDLDLTQAGGKNLHIEPRFGYLAWRAIDVETGEIAYCASLKEILHKIADDLPRMLAMRNFR